MYSTKAQDKIDYIKKWAEGIVAGSYDVADTHDELLKVDLFDSSISLGISDLDISYSLEEDEDLLFTANQLLENIDEALKFKSIYVDTSDYLPEMKLFRFTCKTESGVEVTITIDFSESKNCNLEYEDVTTKKAILKCA